MDYFSFVNQIPPDIRESPWGKVLIEIIKEQHKRIQEQAKVIQEQAERIIALEKTVQELKDEIARLKKMPKRPKFRPGGGDPKSRSGKPGNTTGGTRSNTANKIAPEKIQQEGHVPATEVPEGSRFKGYLTYIIQELDLIPKNVTYKCEIWQAPDGTMIRAALPPGVQGSHYGHQLRALVHNLYALGMTEPGLFDFLGGTGIEISEGQVHNLLMKADLVLGAPFVSSQAGATYVVFGQAGGWPASFNLTTLNGTNGFAIPSIAASGRLGNSVSTAGDLNGDGKADLVLGAPGVSSGAAYVLFGQASGWPAQFNLATLNGLNGFAVNDLAAGDYLGGSVSTAGDINHDGIADLVLGAPGGSTNGTVYVIFGQNTSLVTSTPSTVPSFSTSPSTVRSTPLPTTLNLASITIQVKIPPGLNGTFIPITADILSISTTTIAVPQSN